MSPARTIHLPEIGEVLFEKSAKARRINISVKPLKGIRVAVPRGVAFETARQAAQEKTEWIKAKQQAARQIESRHEELRREPGYISRAAAKGLILERLGELANRHGFTYNKVFIRNQKTRWGSCSYKRNISLNYKITLLPPELMDYVMLHELTHLKHFNHSRHFWEEMDRLLGDAKALDARLSTYQALLLQ